jgi:RecJ-like exonuclease
MRFPIAFYDISLFSMLGFAEYFIQILDSGLDRIDCSQMFISTHGIRDAMQETASRLAEKIRGSKKALVAAHIDADGITAASIASRALEREGIEHKVKFFKNLDDAAIGSIRDENRELTWLVDFGSGELNRLGGIDAVITDHHMPVQTDVPKKKRKNLLDFFEHISSDQPLRSISLNPHDFGKDGATDVSGAGVTYLTAKALNEENIDLAGLQDAKHGRLIGTNRSILEDGKKAGVVESDVDLRFFGRESRPLTKFLQFANDPFLPGLSDSEGACTNFLNDLGIAVLDGDRWRTWSDLKKFERRLIVSGLVNLMLEAGYGSKSAERLIGEVYMLVGEEGMLRSAKEFATLLNSCGRYDRAELGLSLCLGDRDKDLKKALGLLQGHREHIVSSMRFIQDMGVTELEYIQYFHGGDRILDSVVGTIAGMILGSGKVRSNVPIIGFANCPEGVKASARTTKELVGKGLNLSLVMKGAATSVGGIGGGHNIAAGATIPKGKEEEFLKLVENLIRKQLEA